MKRYTVPLTTWASTAVTVEVPDDVTDPEEIVELAVARFPGVSHCHRCSTGFALGDGWDAPRDKDGVPEISEEDA